MLFPFATEAGEMWLNLCEPTVVAVKQDGTMHMRCHFPHTGSGMGNQYLTVWFGVKEADTGKDYFERVLSISTVALTEGKLLKLLITDKPLEKPGEWRDIFGIEIYR
jgi:hypothetical protein